MFSVGAQGRGQRTPRARACWWIRVGQGGKGGQRAGREKGALGIHLPAPYGAANREGVRECGS